MNTASIAVGLSGSEMPAAPVHPAATRSSEADGAGAATEPGAARSSAESDYTTPTDASGTTPIHVADNPARSNS